MLLNKRVVVYSDTKEVRWQPCLVAFADGSALVADPCLASFAAVCMAQKELGYFTPVLQDKVGDRKRCLVVLKQLCSAPEVEDLQQQSQYCAGFTTAAILNREDLFDVAMNGMSYVCLP